MFPRSSPRLVEAKLAAPGVRRGIVARPRVVHALDAGADATLTLVAAPLRAFGLHLGTAVDGRDATSLVGSDHTLPGPAWGWRARTRGQMMASDASGDPTSAFRTREDELT